MVREYRYYIWLPTGIVIDAPVAARESGYVMQRFSRLASAVCVAGLTVATSAFGTAISDLNQLTGSAFSNYAFVAGGSGAHNLQFTSDSPAFGNVALASGVALQGGGDVLHGNLDFGGTANGTGSVIVTGTTTANVAQATNAVADAVSLFAAYTALTGFSGLPTVSGTLNVGTNGGNSNAGNTHEHIYDVTTAGYGGDLTINAGASEYVIINIGKGLSTNYDLNGAVNLTGGITSDHVLFNIATTGNFGSASAHGKTINALIIDNAGKTNVDNFTLNGRIFCTTANADCQFVSGAQVHQPASATPEPGTFNLLAGFGLFGLAGALRRTKKSA
jgi:hypothetical protein